MTSTVSGAKVNRYYHTHTTNPESACLEIYYDAMGQPHIGFPLPNAKSAITKTKKWHKGDTNPPVGVPVWFDTPNGDVVCSDGNGYVMATDYPSWTKIGRCTIQERLDQLKATHPNYPVKYIGWSEDYAGVVTITFTPVKKPVPTKTPRKSILNQSQYSIAQIQRAINAHGYVPKLVVDGKNGPKTAAGLRWVQAVFRLTQDTILGPKTQAVLFPSLKRGDKGKPMVLYSKQRLKYLGYGGFILNEEYGIGLSRAVAKYKKEHKLTNRDGNVIGSDFWHHVA